MSFSTNVKTQLKKYITIELSRSGMRKKSISGYSRLTKLTETNKNIMNK